MSNVRVRFQIKPTKELLELRGLQPGGRVQTYIDEESMKRCDKLVPVDTHMLRKSAKTASRIGYGELRYDTPYGKKQYYENKGKGLRGRLWFERMKADHKNDILRGAQKMAGVRR